MPKYPKGHKDVVFYAPKSKRGSRPIAGSDDTFRFYFDLEASVYSPELPKLLGELEDVCEHVCYLGSYSEMV